MSILPREAAARLLLSCLIAFLFLSPTRLSADDRPNIVLISLDDADRELFRKDLLDERFPNLGELAKRGIKFSNFHVTSPLCGPSRVCLLRGQYAHAMGQRINSRLDDRTRGFTGDLRSFIEKGYYDNDIGKWMRDAGYHTSFVGKHGNGRKATVDEKLRISVPKGWIDYYLSQGAEYYETAQFTTDVDPAGTYRRIPKGIYRTDAEAEDVKKIILNQADNPAPLFLYYAPFGPHAESSNSPHGMINVDHADLWPNVQQQERADFNEFRFADKPSVYQTLKLLPTIEKNDIRALYRKRMLAVRSVDQAVAKIVQALKDTDRYNNTYIFFTSDNGFLLGQHRLVGKGVSFTRAANVPLFVSGPGVGGNQTAEHLLGHIDLAPTFLDLAGAEPKPFFDGKSFAPLLRAPNTVPARDWRQGLLIESWQSLRYFNSIVGATYVQLRMFDSVYTEWADGSREYYDLTIDPLELKNTANSLTAAEKNTFSANIKALRRKMTDPIATIERPPTDFGAITGPPFVVRGVAEDTDGLDSVRVTIRNMSNTKFWNGTDWQATQTTVVAILKNPGGVQSEWVYSFKPPAPTNDAESYKVTPQAVSKNGRVTTEISSRLFKFDSFPPVTFINSLQPVKDKRMKIVGQARDNSELKEVRLHLQNIETKEFYDGSVWGLAARSIRRPLDDDKKWVYVTPELPAGRYLVRARAIDTAGNIDDTPELERFTIE